MAAPSRCVADAKNQMYQGFTCIKGRQLPEQHYHPDRLLHSQKRAPRRRLPRCPSRAGHQGGSGQVAGHHRRARPPRRRHLQRHLRLLLPLLRAVRRAPSMNGIGSNMTFSGGTIDQPAKPIARAYHGNWGAGPQMFDDADVWMLIGANPTISMWGGIPQYNPAKRLHQAKQRGMQFIVIDPRRTEAAEKADIFLQVKPGEDPTLLAGILRVILSEGLVDGDFVAANVQGLEELREAVEPFTLDYVEDRAGVPAAHVERAARIFAEGERGSVTSGTGTGLLTTCQRHRVPHQRHQHRLRTLAARGRAGAQSTRPAQAQGLHRPGLPGEHRLGVAREAAHPRPAHHGYRGRPPSALAEEILMPGEGQIRALICIGFEPHGGLAGPAPHLRGHAGARPARHARHQDVGYLQAGPLRDRPQAPRSSGRTPPSPTRRSRASSASPRATPPPTPSTVPSSSTRPRAPT